MIGKRIKELRIRDKLTQRELADKLSLTPKMISFYELGERFPPNDILIKLTDIFDVSADYLLGRTDSPETKKDAPKRGVRVPVLGRIPAGIPIDAVEDILDYEEIPIEWATGGKEYFALKIKGDSMADKYQNNDVVIFQAAPDCETGAECAVMVNGDDATFKKVIKQKSGIILQPLNIVDYEPVFYSNQEIEELPVTVLGIAKEIRRQA